MRKSLFFLFLVMFFSLVGIWGFFFWKEQSTQLISPVLGVSKSKIAENVWLPQDSKNTLGDTILTQNLSAKAAFFIESKTGQVLYSQNSDEKLPIASLTKIMSVIVALEHRSFDDEYQVSQHAADMEPDKMLLIAGEKMKLEELLDGIFLVSANDAAEVLAEGTTGDRGEFINLMNTKALQLGMVNTHFINPSGLEEDGVEQYSTAYDVSLMARYAINTWPHLVDISSQPHIYIDKNSDHQDYDLNSGINLLTTYPGVMGFKTGYTPEAGLTLITLARKGDKEVIGVLLGSINRRDDARMLLDYSFKKLGL